MLYAMDERERQELAQWEAIAIQHAIEEDKRKQEKWRRERDQGGKERYTLDE